MMTETTTIILALASGLLLGLAAAFVWRRVRARTAQELFRESEAQMKESFRSLSLDALSTANDEFLKLAKAKLDSAREGDANDLDKKKALIDQQLQQMTAKLENVSTLMKDMEKDRSEKFGQLAGQLQTAGQQTQALLQTTNSLREALSSTKARGQWGERMAEDVLRLAGLIENVNYLKQKTIEGVGSRPDFTFLLPKSLRLHMDVKFPLDNYIRFLEAGSDGEKAKFRSDFLRDARARVKEITTREYIDAESNTVDYVLLFIPNEQIYAFIHEQDSAILDEAIRNKVVFCSPITLFAVLAVIRQAVDNFALERTSNEILSLLGAFKKQWDEFAAKFDLLGKKIGDAMREYDALTTTRRRQLEKPLHKIEELRSQRGLPVASDDDRPPSSAGGSES
ncbi:MAG: DNA recombination protein RmuC [Nitrospirae bacterium]|nr:MAG: DNA recombination protein RmuC [Nitrospirota bacterium]